MVLKRFLFALFMALSISVGVSAQIGNSGSETSVRGGLRISESFKVPLNTNVPTYVSDGIGLLRVYRVGSDTLFQWHNGKGWITVGSGSGGGGTTYTAGDNIVITGTSIAADTTTGTKKLATQGDVARAVSDAADEQGIIDSGIIADYTEQIGSKVDTAGSYANPAWISSLAWSKITGTPAINSYTAGTGLGLSGTQFYADSSNQASVKRLKDTAIALRSAIAAIPTPTLQTVTNAGATTTNTITYNGSYPVKMGDGGTGFDGFFIDDGTYGRLDGSGLRTQSIEVINGSDEVSTVNPPGSGSYTWDWPSVSGTLLTNNSLTGAISTALSTNLTANTVVVANGSGKLASLAAGTNGHVLTLVSGVPTWAPSTSGTLQTVLNTGNTASKDVFSVLSGDTNYGVAYDSTVGYGYLGGGPRAKLTLTGQAGIYTSVLGDAVSEGNGTSVTVDDANNVIGLTAKSVVEVLNGGTTGGGKLRVDALKTGATAPTTSGTTKMVVSDANGLLSFTTIPSGGTSYSFTSPLVNTSGTVSIPAATASVNGYMSSTYATKLDGIATGAINTAQGDTRYAQIGLNLSDIDPTTGRGNLGAQAQLNGTGIVTQSGTTTSYTATTGTGSVVLAASPTLTGTLSAATITASGNVTGNNLNITNWNNAYSERNQWDGGSTGLTAATGRTSLGGTTVGQNLFTLTNPSAISFLQINADNSVTTNSASAHRTALGLGSLATISSVSLASGSANISGTLSEGNGGTGNTSYTNGQLLIGNTTTGGLSKATITAGTGITVTNAAGAITIAATGGGGGGSIATTSSMLKGDNAGGAIAATSGTDYAGTSDVQTFTASGTWTKPAGAKVVEVFLVGGGAGGSSGGKAATGVAANGGGGGGAGGFSHMTFLASDLTSTVAVTVGTGGAGGASVTANSTAGNFGSNGVNTTFGIYLKAARGNAATSGGNGGSGGGGLTATGNAGAVTGGSQAAGNVYASFGGGGGGILDAANGVAAGGSGAFNNTYGNYTVSSNAGTSGGGAGGVGVNSGIKWIGYGGGGGGSSITGDGGAGGAGGPYGGGGGGGGASRNSVGNSGAGGNGADGIAVIITYF